jgi:hypothetical protein
MGWISAASRRFLITLEAMPDLTPRAACPARTSRALNKNTAWMYHGREILCGGPAGKAAR